MVPLVSYGPMMRYVPIEETVILIMCSVFVNHMKRIRNTNDRLVDVIVFYPKKNIKLQPVPPLMPLEALLIPVNPTNSDYHGINGGTGCNFIFFYLFMYFSVFTPLTRPLYIISSNLACSSVSSV